MTLPNKLTILRMILVPIFMVFALYDTTWGIICALILFAAAAVTDHYDGKIAREQNLVTTFGKIMDPLADKILVLSAFLIFVSQGRMNVFALMIIIARELAVTSLRVVAMSEGKVLAAGKSGKIKTVTQFSFIIIMLVRVENMLPWFVTVEQILMWCITAVTLWSGIDYFWTNRAIIKSSVKKPQ